MRNTSGLKRTAGPGRPKGSKTRVTKEMQEWARDLFESAEWQQSARQRIIGGKAPHLEAHVMQVLLPKTDRANITGTLTVEWQSPSE